ncbi:Uncharacterised protein g4466 [Pycnogonum litorale]
MELFVLGMCTSVHSIIGYIPVHRYPYRGGNMIDGRRRHVYWGGPPQYGGGYRQPVQWYGGTYIGGNPGILPGPGYPGGGFPGPFMYPPNYYQQYKKYRPTTRGPWNRYSNFVPYGMVLYPQHQRKYGAARSDRKYLGRSGRNFFLQKGRTNGTVITGVNLTDGNGTFMHNRVRYLYKGLGAYKWDHPEAELSCKLDNDTVWNVDWIKINEEDADAENKSSSPVGLFGKGSFYKLGPWYPGWGGRVRTYDVRGVTFLHIAKVLPEDIGTYHCAGTVKKNEMKNNTNLAAVYSGNNRTEVERYVYQVVYFYPNSTEIKS